MSITEDRNNRFKEVAANRQLDITVVLENVHDAHNIGAVLRTCDSVGIGEIFVLNTDIRLKDKGLFFGKASSSGTRKWVKVNYYEEAGECFAHVKAEYKSIFGTHLDKDSVSLYDLDLVSSCALVFGNEHSGISNESLNYLDGNFIIPQYGMVKSLNISVACAITLYESCRQRINSGKYENSKNLYEKALDQYHKLMEIDKRSSRKDVGGD